MYYYNTPKEAVNEFKKLVYFYNCSPTDKVKKYQNRAWLEFTHNCEINSKKMTLVVKFKKNSVKTIDQLPTVKAERVVPQFVVLPDGTEKEFETSKQHFVFKNNTFILI
jgi:hypothetical protein